MEDILPKDINLAESAILKSLTDSKIGKYLNTRDFLSFYNVRNDSTNKIKEIRGIKKGSR